jgi:Holliday junction resolvase
MSLKSKGISAERELIHLLWKRGYAAVRVAGSGSSQYPSCDILAGKPGRTLVFECKSIRGRSRYIPKEEVEGFLQFAERFGAEPWMAFRFSGTAWHFLLVEDLIDTPRSKGISIDVIQAKGVLLEELD